MSQMQFKISWLVLLLGALSFSVANGGVEFSVKERAELEKILASVELSIDKVNVYKVGENITLLEVDDKGRITFSIKHNKITWKSRFRNAVVLDQNDQVIGLFLKRPFKNIEPLSPLAQLRWVHLEGNLSSLQSVNNLTNLEELGAPNNQITALKDLHLPKLKRLDISNNKLKDIPALSTFSALQHLKINDNNIEAFTYFKKLSKLTYLDMSRNPIHDFKVPSTMTLLETLIAPGTTLQAIAFEQLPNIKSIELTNQPIVSISGLENTSQLEELIIIDSKLAGIKVGALRKLRKLYFSSSNIDSIADIEGISELYNLEKLGLSNSNIDKIINLHKLVNLKYLSLANNKISEIESLDNLTNLVSINLSSNKLTKIQGLDHLKNLTLLDLSNNPIEVFEGVGSRMLDKVILSDTKIASIKGFSGFPVLGAVILKNTNIRNLEGYEEYLTPRDSSLVFFLSGNGLSYKEQGTILRLLLKYNVDYIL